MQKSDFPGLNRGQFENLADALDSACNRLLVPAETEAERREHLLAAYGLLDDAICGLLTASEHACRADNEVLADKIDDVRHEIDGLKNYLSLTII